MDFEKPTIVGQSEGFSEVASDVQALFRTPLGQKVLDHFRKVTIEKTTLCAHAADGNAMALMMATREGENNFYRRIMAWIRKGEKQLQKGAQTHG